MGVRVCTDASERVNGCVCEGVYVWVSGCVRR